MFITFSGFDGAGKTTQINKILKYLREKGYKTSSHYDINPSLRYHHGDDFTHYLKHYLKHDVAHTRFRLNSDENNEIMNLLEFIPTGNRILAQYSAYTAYYDYIQWKTYILNHLLENDKIVICDKYYYDDIAYKYAYGCTYEWMKELFYDVKEPDIAIYLKVNVENSLNRKANCKDSKIILYRDSQSTMRLEEGFERLTQETKLLNIDSNGTPEETFEKILNLLKSHSNIF